MTATPEGTVELSRALRLERLAAGDVEQTIEANAQERAALAERFGLRDIRELRGHLTVRRPRQGPLIRVEGDLTAMVTQTCVITLEPVESRIEDSFVQLYTLEVASEPEGEVFAGPDDEEAPEPLTGGRLDLGETLAEQLSLALDPYPKAPGATFGGASFGADETDDADEGESPFAVLKELRNGGT